MGIMLLPPWVLGTDEIPTLVLLGSIPRQGALDSSGILTTPLHRRPEHVLPTKTAPGPHRLVA